MRHSIRLFSIAAAATQVALFAASASAHIELIQPAPRYELPANKSCPCGDGDSNRRCEVTAEESTDPNRSSSVTTFEVGQTITIVAEEYIDHAGRMRVAFDPDGADLADFNERVLMDIADPDDPAISPSNPLTWEFQVQLPNEPCENCTLQVIQVMNNDTENRVADPAPLSTYYTCADIRLVPAGTLGSGGASGGPAGSGGAGGSAVAAGAGGEGGSAVASGGQGGSAVAAGGTSAGGGSSTAGTSSTSGSADAEDEAEDSGCALRATGVGAASAGSLALFGGIALLALRRRRS